MKNLLIFVCSFLCGCTLQKSNSVKSEELGKKGEFVFNSKKVKFCEITNDSGNIKINGTNESNTYVNFDNLKTSSDCTFDVNLKNNGKLIVKHVKHVKNSRFNAESNFDIRLAESANVLINLGGGTISVQNQKGELVIKTGCGKIEIDSPLKMLKLSAGLISQGSFIQGILGNLKIDAGKINAKLKYNQISENVKNIKISSGSGNIDVYLPSQANVKAAFKGFMSVTNEFVKSDKNINFNIKMDAGLACVSIKKE